MSRTIDEKIVEMKFDNSDFEKNVKTSMSTLDKLKEALNFKGAKKGIEEVTDASDKLANTTSDGIQRVQYKFNAMYALTAKIFDRLSDKALNMVKSMSLDQVTAGMEKYEQKVSAVQTIMSATGRSIEEVTEQLEILNWFSDETSYSFTDMADNVGKFTAAGVKLEDAVNAMQGIANWAAISGQNAQAASRAMYNLSQSMGVGYVNLMDWKSIENANMGTLAFKETALETAAALGVLVKAGEDASGVMQYYNEATQEFYSALNFRETLSDKWFTRDILEIVLNQYGAYASAVKMVQDRLSDAYGLDFTASETMQQIDQFIKRENIDGSTESLERMASALHLNVEEASALYETYNSVGKEAFEAAQQAKTWTDVLNATADAVSSSWMRAFETIFGDYQDAKVLFTDMANEMWNIFAGPIDALASTMADVMNHKSAWDTIKDFLGADDIGKTSEEWENALLKVTNGMKYFYGTTIDLREGSETFGEEVAAQYTLQELINRFGSLEKVTERGYLTMEDYQKALRELGVEFNLTGDDAAEFEEALYALTEKGGRIKLIEGLGKLYNVIKDVFTAIKTAFTNVFSTSMSERLSRFIDGFYNLTKGLELTQEASESITNAFEGIFKGLRLGLNILSSITSAVMSVVGAIVPYISKAFTFVFGVVSERIGGIADLFDSISEYFQTKFEEIGEAIQNSQTLRAIKDGLDTIKSYASGVWATIVDTVGSVNANSVIEFFDTLAGTVMSFAATVLHSDIVGSGIGFVTKAISELGKSIKDFRLPTLQEASASILSFVQTFTTMAPAELGNMAKRIEAFASGKLSYKLAEVTDTIGQVYGNSRSLLGKALDWLIRIVRKISELLTNFVSFSLQSIYVATKKILQLAQMFAAFKLMLSAANFLDAIAHKFQGDKAGGIEGVLLALSNVIKRLGMFAIEMLAVVYLFGKMPEDVSKKGFTRIGIALGGLLTIIIAALGLAHGLSTADINGVALMIAALGLSVKLIADALKELNDISINIGSLAALGVVLTGFFFFIKSLGTLGPDRIKGVLPLVALASGLKMMLSVIEEYSKFNWSQNIKGIAMLIPMMYGMIAVVKSLGSAGKINTLAFVGLAVALKLMVSTIEDLGSLNAGILVKGTAALWAIVNIIKIFTSVIKDMNAGLGADAGKLKTSIATFVGVVILLLGAVAAVAILGKMGESHPKQLMAGVRSVSVILGMISVLLKSLGSLSDVNGWKIVGVLAGVTLILAALAAIYKYLMSDADYTNALNSLMMVTALVAEIVVLASAAALLGHVDPSIMLKGLENLAIAAAFLALLVTVVDGIMVFIGSLNGAEEALAKAVTISTLIGNIAGSFIGGFFGGLRGGAAEAYAKHMPKIGEYLSEFGKKIGGFINFVTTVGNEGKTTTMSLFMDSITDLITGLINLSKKHKDLETLPYVGTQLGQFMMNLIQNGYFFTGLDEVDASQIEAAQTIAKIIEALAPISTSKGIKSLWSGSTNYKTLSENLNGHAETITNFADKLAATTFAEGIKEKVQMFGDISYAVIQMFNKLPQGTGLIDTILGGSQNWKTVGNNFGWFRGVINNFVDDIATQENYTEQVKNKVEMFGEIVSTIIDAFNKISGASGMSLSIAGFTLFENQNWASIGEGLEEFVESIKNFIMGVSDISKIDNYGTIGQTVQSIIDSVNVAISDNAVKLEWTGRALGDQLLNGMSESLWDLDNKITYFVARFQEGFGNYHSNFETEGANVMGRLIQGIEKRMKDVRAKAAAVAAAINTALRIGYGGETSLWDKMYTVGQNAAEGLYNGMTSRYADNLVKSGGSRLGRLAYEAAKKAIESNSPSKKFMQLGEWSAEGFNMGVSNSLNSVVNTMDRLGETSIDSLRNAMSNIGTAINDENAQPVIRPVLDLSNVDDGMSNLLGSNYNLGIGTTRTLTNSIKIQNGDNSVAGAISNLREDLNTMKNEMLGMRIVMDSGALVGSISTKMDSALGTISTYKGRGNI